MVQIEHLAFDTFISFPEKIFNENGIKNRLVSTNNLTINEFQNIIENLYQMGYVLVDIFDYINIEKNTIKINEIHLPQNKKPLLLSFDNVTYINSYQNLGQIDKIILDRNHNLASYTTKKSIQEKVEYNNEFILILENFITAHPDFSFNNARGIIFFTGEHGILGYDTCHNHTNHKYETKRVTEVIQKLSSLGWRFGANEYYLKEITSNIDLIKSTTQWKNEIEPIVGNTPLFASLHSSAIYDSPNNITTLTDNGFNILFINDFNKEIKLTSNHIILPRKKLTYESIINNKDLLSKLFRIDFIFDNLRNVIL